MAMRPVAKTDVGGDRRWKTQTRVVVYDGVGMGGERGRPRSALNLNQEES